MSIGAGCDPTVTQRTCVGCRRLDAKNHLIRVIVREGVLRTDLHQVLPGRGAWIHPTQSCVAQAKKQRAFLRAFRLSELNVPARVFQEIVETHSGSYGADRCVADESGLEADGHPMSTQR